MPVTKARVDEGEIREVDPTTGEAVTVKRIDEEPQPLPPAEDSSELREAQVDGPITTDSQLPTDVTDDEIDPEPEEELIEVKQDRIDDPPADDGSGDESIGLKDRKDDDLLEDGTGERDLELKKKRQLQEDGDPPPDGGRIKKKRDPEVNGEFEPPDEGDDPPDDKYRVDRDPLKIDGDRTDTWKIRNLWILPPNIEDELDYAVEGRYTYKMLRPNQLIYKSNVNPENQAILSSNSSDVLFIRAIHSDYGSGTWPTNSEIVWSNLVSDSSTTTTTAVYELVRGYLYRPSFGASAAQFWNDYVDGANNGYVESRSTSAIPPCLPTLPKALSGVRLAVFNRSLFKDSIVPGTFQMLIKPSGKTSSMSAQGVEVSNETETSVNWLGVTGDTSGSLSETATAGTASMFTFMTTVKFNRSGPRYQTLFHRPIGNKSLSSWGQTIVSKKYGNLYPPPTLASIGDTVAGLTGIVVFETTDTVVLPETITAAADGAFQVVNSGSGNLYYGISADRDWVKFIWPEVLYDIFPSSLDSWSGENGRPIVQLDNGRVRWATTGGAWAGNGHAVLSWAGDGASTALSMWYELSSSSNPLIQEGASNLMVKFDVCRDQTLGTSDSGGTSYNILKVQLRRDMPTVSASNPQAFNTFALDYHSRMSSSAYVAMRGGAATAALSAVELPMRFHCRPDQTFVADQGHIKIGFFNWAGSDIPEPSNADYHIGNLRIGYQPGTLTGSATSTPISAYVDSSVTAFTPDKTWQTREPNANVTNREWNANIVVYNNHPWLRSPSLPLTVPVKLTAKTRKTRTASIL